MKKITSKDLINLGFYKENGDTFHYYVYDINDKGFLISCANDEKVNGSYTVEFYELEGLIFSDLKDLENQMKIINKLNINK